MAIDFVFGFMAFITNKKGIQINGAFSVTDGLSPKTTYNSYIKSQWVYYQQEKDL
jgi:hypothetical protein